MVTNERQTVSVLISVDVDTLIVSDETLTASERIAETDAAVRSLILRTVGALDGRNVSVMGRDSRGSLWSRITSKIAGVKLA